MFSRGHRASRRIGRVDGPRWRPVRSGRGQEQSMEWVVWVLVGAALLLVGAAGLFPGAAPAQLIRPPPLAEATRPQFADLARVLPDIGRFDPNPWGLTFEIRDHEQPHWTGQRNSPATFGHFGGTGTFLCPEAGLATVVLTGRDFGPWALEAWPSFSDAVLERYAPFRQANP